jgi:NtrC-family two-component system sensor histidine kinase KinB
MLRTRLFLNLLPFLVILVAISFFAILLVFQIAREAEQLSVEYHRALLGATGMKRAAAQMDTGVQLALQEEVEAGRVIFDENARVFEEDLHAQIARASLPQEAVSSRQLATHFDEFRRSGTRIFDARQGVEREALYRSDFTPTLKKVDHLAREIYALNERAIKTIEASIQARRADSIRFMAVAIIAALLFSAWGCYRLGRSIFRPIDELTKATCAVGQGNLDQVVPVVAHDELGALARAFNQMATQLREARHDTSQTISRLHHAMEAALASFPDPVFILSSDAKIELKNPAAATFSRDLSLDGRLPLLLHSEVNKVLQTGDNFLPLNFKDTLFFRIKQQEKYYLPRVLAMRNEAGLIIGAAILLLDVTRFRLMDDLKSNLVATVSHELKTPLTGVRMVLHILLEHTVGPLTPKQNELLLAARDDAERLLRILNNLLDLTRFEAGGIDVNFEEVAPAELIQRAVEETREPALGKGLTLVSELDPDVPPVRADRQRISHVFANLLSNAIKHSPVGERIILRAMRAKEGGVCFVVVDHGPGIPEQYHNRIFDRFFRVPGQAKKGAGLGLSIAKEIVAAHGGEIGVRSRLGEGSEFYVVLRDGPGSHEDSGPEKAFTLG